MFRGAPLCKAAAKKQPFPKSWAVEQSTAAIRSVGNILVETPRIRLTQTVGTLALSSRGRVDLLSQEHSLNCAGCARMGEPPVCAGTAAAHHVYIYIYIRELSAGYSAITSSKVLKKLSSAASYLQGILRLRRPKCRKTLHPARCIRCDIPLMLTTYNHLA